MAHDTPMRASLSVLLSVAATCGLVGSDVPFSPHTPLASPETILWAWERPEDLSFLPPDVGVAALAATFDLRADQVGVTPRRNRLKIREGTVLTAVAHVHVSLSEPPTFSTDQREFLAQAILSLYENPPVETVQVDYEAPPSQRDFFLNLLGDLAAGKPPGRRLSVTALASWCLTETWAGQLPVDEVVPMVFRMGGGAAIMRERLETSGFRLRNCRSAVGVATDEPVPGLARGARVYIFNPRPWDPETFGRMLAALGRHG